MNNISNFQNKNVLVLGMAKSGYAASRLLKKLGATVTVNDRTSFEQNEIAQKLKSEGFNVVCGEHPLSLVDDQPFCIVKNPGIPYTNPLLIEAVKRNIPIYTEIELAYLISEAPFIGITGSNGKTTTTTLALNMLQEGNKKPLVAGNIGTVACEVAENANEDNIIVTELSSFQLMGIESFRPKISLITNIFEAHLDYHGTKDEYIKAKANIFKNQTENDFAVVNFDDENVMAMASQIRAKIIPFSSTKIMQDGAYVQNGFIYFKEKKVIEVEKIVLPGKHNLENILAAVAISKLLDVENDAIEKVLTTFTGVEHRLQFVTEINKRKFYNDSKATNILATQKAISSFQKPVILIAGGLDRGNGFDDLIPYFKNVKKMVTYGQTAEKLIESAEKAGMKAVKSVDNVEDAVNEAFAHSEVGDIILLSPACASWDQFKTFEERGNKFIQAVHKLM
ncbi:UDP-N-acetylmuramoyl-L-alanine--D-glutamate ligase [Bacillus sp. AFS077874]|uniref:UDP-N-acetylmuramoyl-L-alanine--D-glutamate ligase n=1 Tax=unclassified Bacillus (in: firmicutes) TaxID=185979 RepID=UPI000BEC7046|nr:MULTISPECIES: UDP-N-acetylmuramoyl-L-alanine--D-glutamate ligase [unclassified Bacillus (in: firmicutes)]PEC49830.1 UDP-N-acetylmuramoyl-L-alanine--D-glutamate ligase [Bacillus sp. AFS096315]PFM79495.1 UDP-N-acetylmuramoyl-L-alanine--D-glutamate ligase [Bacillus sp. AFS077874]